MCNISDKGMWQWVLLTSCEVTILSCIACLYHLTRHRLGLGGLKDGVQAYAYSINGNMKLGHLGRGPEHVMSHLDSVQVGLPAKHIPESGRPNPHPGVPDAVCDKI